MPEVVIPTGRLWIDESSPWSGNHSSRALPARMKILRPLTLGRKRASGRGTPAKARETKPIRRPVMTPKLPRLLLAALLAGSFGISSELPGKNAVFAGLTAHEWGTFTSIAGRDGQAIDWLPLSGSTDLPGFVQHLRDGRFKIGLRGTVRMETPVLYFYDSREERVRSEEHTSELQSLTNLVCRLLLEKKKKK